MRVQSSSDWKVMADMKNSARERNAVCDMLSLEMANIGTDLVDGNIVALTGVGFGERVHCSSE